MRKRFSIVIISIFCGMLCFTSVLIAEDQKKDWSSSYELFRSHFKSLSQSEVVFCERLLREVLNDLDIRNQCNGDADCGLIDQEPFGATVPFPESYFVSMKAKMKEYFDCCDDGFSHPVKHDDLIYEPVCIEGKCMVSTSFKKESQ